MSLVDEFIATHNRSSTRKAYEYDLKTLSDGVSLSRENVAAVLAPEIIRAHFARARRDGVSSAVIRRRRAALSAFLRWLQHEDLVRLPKALDTLDTIRGGMRYDRTDRFVLQAADVIALLETAGGTAPRALRDRAIILTIFSCFLRRSELVRMDVEHFRVQGSYTFIDLPADGEHESLFVRIPQAALQAIQSMQKKCGIVNGPLWRSFSNNSLGQRLSARSIHRVIQRAAARAEINGRVNADSLRLSGLIHLFACETAALQSLPVKPIETLKIWRVADEQTNQ